MLSGVPAGTAHALSRAESSVGGAPTLGNEESGHATSRAQAPEHRDDRDPLGQFLGAAEIGPPPRDG
jgi:hypothetical protein